MDSVRALVSHWGYLALFACVVLGNIGIPVPEESVLRVAGYLVWRGRLQFPLVLLVRIVAAVGDCVNLILPLCDGLIWPHLGTAVERCGH